MSDQCPICCNSKYSPYREHDSHGKIVAGCVAEFHTGHLTPISESSRWHNRKEAKQIRRKLLAGQQGKGY